ncbi:MAG: thrombospondin type 3 repeat-containing protein [Deltaproteobacteria bacterium]|nr:thrombospondin type 3 repeat-containing protein [Deltaproteobacteria bacterium]
MVVLVAFRESEWAPQPGVPMRSLLVALTLTAPLTLTAAHAETLDASWERTTNHRVGASAETTAWDHYASDGEAWNWTAEPTQVWPHVSSTGQRWLYTLDYAAAPGVEGTQYWFRTTLPLPTGPVSHLRISDALLGDAIHLNSSITTYLDGARDALWSISDPATSPALTNRDGPRWEVAPLLIDVCDMDLSQGVELAILFEETYGWGGLSEFRIDTVDDGRSCVTGSTPDSDGDGVPDDQDLCLGLDASGDTDSDGVCDASDNCPTDPNPGQADSDSDSIGDVCETDVDADGTIDDLDNCPAVFNADQGDTDGDGFGDVCDGDDDDDGVGDGSDNCALLPNAAQTDSDGDGQGDVCDGDDDADDIDDVYDLCPGTALDVAVSDDGCSGQQLVSLECAGLCGAPTYVGCVAQASNDAKADGLLTGREKAAIVRRAAKGSCN